MTRRRGRLAAWRERWDGITAPLIRGDTSPATLLPAEFQGGGWDKWLMLGAFGLVLFGLAMIYSATSLAGPRSSTFVENHGIKVILGICAFLLAHRIDYHRWGRMAPLAYCLGLVLLLLVYVPGLGHTAGNARRWLTVGSLTIQPADFARLALVVYLAFLLSKPKIRLERFTTGVLPCLLALGVMWVLVILQPNLSTAIALVAVTGLMLVAGRIPWKHLGALVLGAVIVGGTAAKFFLHEYQTRRLLNFGRYLLHGEGLQEGNYQMHQSILAIGSGGLLGRGLGESRQKWSFLPDAHTDFIFAIVGEELGLLGAVVLIGLVLVVLWRAYDAARRAPDRFGSLLAVGIGSSVAIYAGINLLVATGMFPTTGLPLPLVSYGGTAIMVMLFSLGILGNVSSQGDSTLLVGIGEQE